MNIAVFSGSFNPIHVGHCALARYFALLDEVDQVWLMVSPQNPLKVGRDMASAEQRLAMARLATEHDSGIFVSDFELQLPTPSYTYLTLRALAAARPNDKISLIIGADNMDVFDQWRNNEEILERYQILVYPRQDCDMAGLKARYPQMRIYDAPQVDVSSTQIRHMIAQGHDCRQYVGEKVYKYIIDSKLYKQ